MNDCEVGQIVRSIAGRDKNVFMIVVGIPDEDHVLIADGDIRKINHPKLKKRKHISVTNSQSESLRESILSGKKVQNAEIRKILEPWNRKISADASKEV